MNPGVAAALFLAGFLAAALLWSGLRVLGRRVRVVEELRDFARARGAFVDGDGAEDALRVVGSARGRPFTVAYQADWLRGSVLMAAVDCAAAARGPVEAGGVAAEAGDAALATRFVGAGPEVSGRIAEIVDALVAMAEELEARGASPEEPE